MNGQSKDVQSSASPQNVQTESSIKDLVRRFRVCWDVYPEKAVVDKKSRDIGFSLELLGTHEPGVDHVSPGCVHCRRVQSALYKIARDAGADRTVGYEQRRAPAKCIGPKGIQ